MKRESHDDLERDVSQAAKKEAITKSRSSGSSGSASNKPKPPSSFEAFSAHDGVTLHLVVKDSNGEEVKAVQMSKKEYSSGSFGWTLNDKVVVDNGEGGTMSILLSGNCAVAGSKPKGGRS